MAISPRLRELIDRSAKMWAAEAEVVRTYFQSQTRNRETDRAWLARQCFKEIWGSGLTGRNESLIQGWSRQLIEWFPKIDQSGNGGVNRYEVLEIAEALHEEFEHYCLFADAYDAMAANDEPRITPMGLKTVEGRQRKNGPNCAATIAGTTAISAGRRPGLPKAAIAPCLPKAWRWAAIRTDMTAATA